MRQAKSTDREAILEIHRAAFGSDEEAHLVAALLDDPSAAPRLSMLAEQGSDVIAHILFTRVTVPMVEQTPSASILCPVAVHPSHQSKGVGSDLARAGLSMLRDQGCDLVFVLGHPGYYPRFGFRPAGAQGLQAPYPIPPEHADAWMVLPLSDRHTPPYSGQIQCAESLSDPRYWTE